MKLEQIPVDVRSRALKYRWDRIIEKHEGPETWEYLLEGNKSEENYVELLTVNGFHVLLPVGKENHDNITFDRCVPSADGNTLTIFLNDTTYDTGLFSGYMAVCEKVPNENWYIAILYHECWISRLESVG